MFRDLNYLNKLQEQDSPWALYWLGYYHYEGLNGAEQDFRKAYQFYKRAYDKILALGDAFPYPDWMPGLRYVIGYCLYHGYDGKAEADSGRNVLRGIAMIRELAREGHGDSLQFVKEHKIYFSAWNIFKRCISRKNENLSASFKRLKANLAVYLDIRAHDMARV